MKVKVWYKIIDDYDNYEYKLEVHYKYKVSMLKSRKGSYVAITKNGLHRHGTYETIEEFYERMVEYMQFKSFIVENKVSELISKEIKKSDIKSVARQLAKKGFSFEIKNRI